MKTFKPLADSVALAATTAVALPSLPAGAVLRVACNTAGFRYRFGDNSVAINMGTQGTVAGAPVVFLYPEDGATHIILTNDGYLSYGYLL
jgi:hypothetical protein